MTARIRVKAARIATVFLAGTLLVSQAYAQLGDSGKLSTRQIAANSLPSTVLIVARNPTTGKAVSGSGFFVSDDVIVTNHHVIKDATEILVRPYGQERDFRVINIESRDADNDLALLKVSGTKGKPLRLSADDSTAIGEDVFVVSSPKGLEGTFSPGIVSSKRIVEGMRLLQITAPISHGSSGGAVLNDKGLVIGVAVGALSDGQSLNFAIPISFLRPMISQLKTGEASQGRVTDHNSSKPVQPRKKKPVVIDGVEHEEEQREIKGPEIASIYAPESRFGFAFQLHPMVQKALDHYRGIGRSEMEVGLYRSGMFMSMARRVFRSEGVPENVAWTAQIVSNWEPSRPAGLWNFTAELAEQYGLQRTQLIDERGSFDESSQASARYLKFLFNRYGSWEFAMAAYVCGESNVNRAIARAKKRDFWAAYPYLPQVTRDSVPKILATILIANNPQQYGFGQVRAAPPLHYDRIRVPASTNLSILAQASDTSVQFIRYLNPHMRSNVTPPEPYIINVPAGKASDVVAIFKRIPASKINNITLANSVQGETWQTISNRTGVSVAELMAANPGMETPTGKVFVPVKVNSGTASGANATTSDRDIGIDVVIVTENNYSFRERLDSPLLGSPLRLLEKGDMLALLERFPTGGYYNVIDIETNIEGWIHKDFVSIKLTDKPNAPPDFEETKTGSDVDPTLKIANQTDKTLRLRLGGQLHIIAPRVEKTVELRPGQYKFFASVPGVIPVVGDHYFSKGITTSWRFFITTQRQTP